MRLLHLNDHLRWAGGIETWLLTVLPLLQSRGITSSVLFAHGEASLVHDGRCVPGIGSNRFTDDHGTARAVAAEIADVKPAVIHINGIQNLGAMRACLDSGTPVIMTGHDYRTICPASMFYHKRTQTTCHRTCGPGCVTTTLRKHCLTPRPRPAAYYYRRARWTMRHADRFAKLIAPSQGAATRFLAAGFASDRVQVLPYFCPMEPALVPRLIPERPTLTFIGRLAENKGWQTFIQALGKLPPTWQGIIVGPLTEDLETRARQLAEQAGCGNRLSLQPWAGRDEVRRVLQNTTIFTFPSLWPETLGIVGLEALSQGVPVIASDIGGVREWLEDGANGFLVPPGSADAIARTAQQIIETDSLEAFGKRGIQTIRERFSADQHVDRLTKIYEEFA